MSGSLSHKEGDCAEERGEHHDGFANYASVI
jgi:hypothetical protein